jgi:hypothetical protein
MRDDSVRRIDRPEIPLPEVSRRLLARFGRFPGDSPAFLEVDHVILTNAAPRQ